MGLILAVIIFACVVIIAFIVIFILFVKKGMSGAKEQKSLFEQGQITEEQYNSNFNQKTVDVVNENYKELRRLNAEDQKKLDQIRKKDQQ